MEYGRLRFVQAFLTPLGLERSSNTNFFFFLVLLAQKNLFAISFYNFSCSSFAGEFRRHFVCANRYKKQFFCQRKKKFLSKKNCWRIFFLKLKNHVRRFPGRTKIAEEWKHCLMQCCMCLYPMNNCARTRIVH